MQSQAQADADYFVRCLGRTLSATERATLQDTLLRAYRGQYIVSGAQNPRVGEALSELVTAAQMQRIGSALAPIATHVAG